MTAFQLILTIPFLALWIYVALNVFETFKLMLHKGQISDEVRKRRRKRFKITVIAAVIYAVFAILAFLINYIITPGK